MITENRTPRVSDMWAPMPWKYLRISRRRTCVTISGSVLCIPVDRIFSYCEPTQTLFSFLSCPYQSKNSTQNARDASRFVWNHFYVLVGIIPICANQSARTQRPRRSVDFFIYRYALIASVALAGSSETTMVKERSFALPNLSHHSTKSSTSATVAFSTSL